MKKKNVKIEKDTINTRGRSVNIVLPKRPEKVYTEADLYAYACIDESVWECTHLEVKPYQAAAKIDEKIVVTQMVSMKARFKKRKNAEEFKFMQRFEQGLYLYQFDNRPMPSYKDIEKKCAIINAYDAHIDKVTRMTETGTKSDIHKNVRLFRNTFNQLLQWCQKGGNPELIIFPVGNDFFNVNDARYTTKKGTPQDTVMHIEDSYEIGLDLIRDCIEEARKIAPVIIPIIRGNHDTDLTGFLGVTLAHLYKGDKAVTVDNSRLSRKYIQYGKNMFMFGHGDTEKKFIQRLPQVVAQEQKKMWYKTEYRYAFLGDLHHRIQYGRTTIKDQVGLQINYLRAMSSQDYWHHSSGYIGIPKSMYCTIFDRSGKDKEDKEKMF